MDRLSRPRLPAKFALLSFSVLVACGLGLTYVIGQFVEVRFFPTIALAVGTTLAFIFLAEFAVVKSASDTITRQNLGLRQLSDELTASCEQLKAHYLGTLTLLNQAVDAREKGAGAYSSQLKAIAHKMGGRLALGPDAHRRIEFGSLFHNIGKIGVPERVLQKPGPLNGEEMAFIQEYPRRGAEIIRSVPFLADTADVVEHHHEWFDGTGYPDGMAGEDIPVEARIISVVDAFDAMTHDRPYREALPSDVAVKELISGKGTQFDPGIVDLFLLYLAEDQGVTLPPEDELRKAA